MRRARIVARGVPTGLWIGWLIVAAYLTLALIFHPTVKTIFEDETAPGTWVAQPSPPPYPDPRP